MSKTSLFKSSRETVEGKRRFFKSCGKGNVSNKAVALTEEEVEKISSGGAISNTDPDELCGTGVLTLLFDPDGLVSAMWFLLALNFGPRGSHECRQLTEENLSENNQSVNRTWR